MIALRWTVRRMDAVAATRHFPIPLLGIETLRIHELHTARGMPRFVVRIFIEHQDREKRTAPAMRFLKGVARQFLTVKARHIVRKVLVAPRHAIYALDGEPTLDVVENVARLI